MPSLNGRSVYLPYPLSFLFSYGLTCSLPDSFILYIASNQIGLRSVNNQRLETR